MSEHQGRKKASRPNKTMPSNVLTSNNALGHAPLPQDHSNMPYPLAMYPHHPYYRPHQPYSYDSAAYPFTYHLHGEYPPLPGTMDPSFGMAYPASDPSSRGDVIPASIKCVSGVDEQSHTSSDNSAETSSFNVQPSSSERHSGVPVGGPHGLWYAASNHMIPGATQPHHYGTYQGMMNHPYKAASIAHKYKNNMQPVDSSTSGAVSHHAASRTSGAAFDYIEQLGSANQAISSAVSESWESTKHYNDPLGQTEPAALSGAALQSSKQTMYKTGTAFTGRMGHSIPSASSVRGVHLDNHAAFSGADIRSSSQPSFKTGNESASPADKTDMTLSEKRSQKESAAALSGAVYPSSQSSLRTRKGSLTVATAFPTDSLGIYRQSSYSPPRGSHARLGLSFTTSSDQTSGRTGSFSTSRSESEEGPDDMTADIPFSGMYLNASNLSHSTSGLRMSGTTDKRARKNELARQRSFKIKEHIEEILHKPEVAITSEEARVFHHYEAKRLMKNERSRNLAKGKKHKIMAIRSKPLNERTREEQMYLDRAMKAKFRKNEGDRLRRLRAKESSLALGDSSSKLFAMEDSFSEDLGVQVIPMEDRLAEYHDEPLSPDFRNAISYFAVHSPYTAQSAKASQGILPPSLQETLSSSDPALFYAISPIRNPAFEPDFEQGRNQANHGNN